MAVVFEEGTIAIDEYGQVFAFGENFRGCLGIGESQNAETPTRVAGLPAPVRQVAAGWEHTGIVTDAGDLLMCGNAEYGQLGFGDFIVRLCPTLVPRAAFNDEAVLMVACGYLHTVVATEGGGVYTFGRGKCGQLGHGDNENQYIPKRVPTAEFNGERVVFVAAGDAHTLALSEAGHVFTWGYGKYGQLGHGNKEDQWAPRQLQAGQFGGDAPEQVVFVAARGNYTMAVTAGGQLYTWGKYGYARFGHDDTNYRLLPTLVQPEAFEGSPVVMAACADYHALVVTADGALWASGQGLSAQVRNIRSNSYTFEKVWGDTGVAFGGARVVMATTTLHHSAALTEDGKLWTWGVGKQGQLGHGDVKYCFTPKHVAFSSRVGRLHNLPRGHALAFAMGAHNRLGVASPVSIVSGEQGLLSMITKFCNEFLANLPEALKKSEGLLRLLGVSQQQYQMQMIMTPSFVAAANA